MNGTYPSVLEEACALIPKSFEFGTPSVTSWLYMFYLLLCSLTNPIPNKSKYLLCVDQMDILCLCNIFSKFCQRKWE